MKILHLTPEIAPWSKAGGLGDAAAALVKSLALLGHEIRIGTPLYGSIPGRERMPIALPSLKVGVYGDPRAAACRVREHELGAQAKIWFIEHEYFYGTKEVYPPREDAGERAAFFARATLDACLATSWIPDIIHCHDWTAGLIPVLLKTSLKDSPLGHCPTVLTIHNLQHQGLQPQRLIPYLGLPENLWNSQALECLGAVNFLKGGILFADRIITVSPTYAREILTPEFGFGLDEVVRLRQKDLEGILNGVDTEEWNPQTDTLIAEKFSKQKLQGKATCKTALQTKLKLDTKSKAPLVGVISRLWEQKGLDLAVKALPEFLRQKKIQFVLLGSGDPVLEQEFRKLAQDFPGDCTVQIGYNHELSHQIEAGADFFLMPSRFEPCGLNQLYSMAYGTVPIVRATGGLADTVSPWPHEQSTGIVFQHADVGGINWALDQAIQLFQQPAAYQAVQKRGMSAKFDWVQAARRHESCYQSLQKQRQNTPAKTR
jgi:starch synthase